MAAASCGGLAGIDDSTNEDTAKLSLDANSSASLIESGQTGHVVDIISLPFRAGNTWGAASKLDTARGQFNGVERSFASQYLGLKLMDILTFYVPTEAG